MEHNVKNFAFDNVVGKHAKEQFKLWHFSKEWRVGIIILSFLKTLTWLVSIYAGYYFLFNALLPVIRNVNITYIFAAIVLIALELLTWHFMSKFFKFLYKGIIVTAVFSGIITAIIYFVSFYMSTNGLAMRQSDQIDRTEIITKNNDVDIELIKNKYNDRIEHYYVEIKDIKANPAGWRNGQPTRLTADQLKDIKTYNINIDSLDRQMKHDIFILKKTQTNQLAKNKTETTAQADKYYNYVFAIMIAQFIFNALLMFAWSRIYVENDRNTALNEDIEKAENTIIANFFSHIATRLFDEAGKIQKSIEKSKEIPFEISMPEIQQTPVVGFQSNSSNYQSNSSNIGFKQGSNNSSNTDRPTENQPITKSNVLGKLRTNDMLRYCLTQKNNGKMNMTEKEIRQECNVKKWKYYEFQNLMISANLINEPNKYK